MSPVWLQISHSLSTDPPVVFFWLEQPFVSILPIWNVFLPRPHGCTITCCLLPWVLSPRIFDCLSGSRCAGVRAEPQQLHLFAVIEPWEKTISSSTPASASAAARFELLCKLSFFFSLLPASWPSPLLSSSSISRVLLVLYPCSASEGSSISLVIFKCTTAPSCPSLCSINDFSPQPDCHLCQSVTQLLLVNSCRFTNEANSGLVWLNCWLLTKYTWFL